MRRVRLTYPGAFHHVMNRGYGGNDIFYGNKNKNQFLDYLKDASKKMIIRIFAYCIMDTHYHLVLENTTGRMSDFLKLLNGNYGMYYRKVFGGIGYVFQGRYKSTIIENDAYLIQSLVYLLQNPVRAGIVHHAEHYIWSSASDYFSDIATGIVDAEFVNQLFGTKDALFGILDSMGKQELAIQTTDYGEVLGKKNFVKSALRKFERRQKPSEQSRGGQRIDERYFDPVEKVLGEFERMNGVKIWDINTTTFKGKRLRGELLVQLKDRAGLKYKEIAEMDIFSRLSFTSLGSIYRNIKKAYLKKVK